MSEETLKKVGITLASLVASFLLFWLFFLNHVGPNEVGVTFNSFNGQIQTQPHAGWYVTSPLTRATTISTLYMRVDLIEQAAGNSGVARVIILPKWVRVKPDKVIDFIKFNGFEYYQGQQGLYGVLRNLAFSNQSFDFIEIKEANVINANELK